MRKITRDYVLSATEVRDAIFYWLANTKACQVPATYDDATITWDQSQKVYICWIDEISDEPASVLSPSHRANATQERK